MKRLLQSKILFFAVAFSAVSFVNAQTTAPSFLGIEGGVVNVVRGSANGDTLWAGLQQYGGGGGSQSRWDLQRGGIYTSFNGGTSWRPTPVAFTSVLDIEVQPNDSRHIFAATATGIFSSTDGGAAWSPAPSLSSSFNCISFSVQDPNIIFAGGSGIQKSTDGGITWSGLGFSDMVRAIATDPQNASVVYAGTESDGVFKSTDGGATWVSMKSNLTDPASLRVHSLLVNPLLTSNIVAGTDAGPFFILSFPGNWFPVSTGLRDSVAQSLALGIIDTVNISQNSLKLYLGTKGNDVSQRVKPVQGGLYVGSVSALLWEPLFTKNADVNSIFIPVLNPSKIIIGTSDGVYSLQSDGSGVGRVDAGIRDNRIASVAVGSQHPGLMYAAVFGGGVFKTADGGTTWNAANSGIQNPYVRAVAVDPTNDSIVFAASALGAFKSTDGGASWNALNLQWQHKASPAQENLFFDFWFSISPVNPRYIAAASAAADCFVSTDGGTSWNILRTPLASDSTVMTGNIVFDRNDANTLYFTQRGVWKTTDLGGAWTDITGDLPIAATNSVGGHLVSDPNNAARMYLPLFANSAPEKLYRTENGGIHWQPVSLDSVVDVSVSKDNSAVLFAATPSAVYRSADSGATWRKLTPDFSGGAFLTLSPDSFDNNIRFAGSTNGIFRVKYSNEPQLEAVALSLDFGATTIGQTVSASFGVSNGGDVPLRTEFSGITGSTDFSFQSDTVSFITPGETKSYSVSYFPHSSGAAAATLELAANDPYRPLLSVALAGAGVANNPITRTVLFDTSHGIAAEV
ncbi:MAG: hypothetical protein KGJ59_12630, partial [Bacteroidota bacterium]|nr:hypothetical protein [Bacteroidota bacterium]